MLTLLDVGLFVSRKLCIFILPLAALSPEVGFGSDTHRLEKPKDGAASGLRGLSFSRQTPQEPRPDSICNTINGRK